MWYCARIAASGGESDPFLNHRSSTSRRSSSLSGPNHAVEHAVAAVERLEGGRVFAPEPLQCSRDLLGGFPGTHVPRPELERDGHDDLRRGVDQADLISVHS
jgi:hypothetical protein